MSEQDPATIRKQFDQITREDWLRFPAWNSCLDEEGLDDQDESTMKPHLKTGPLSYPSFYGHVLADVQLQNGQKLLGLVEVTDSDPLEDVVEVTVLLDGEVSRSDQAPEADHWNQVIMSSDDYFNVGGIAMESVTPDAIVSQLIAHVYRTLGLKKDAVFPLTVCPRVEVEGWPPEWQVEGWKRPDGKLLR